MKVLLINGSPHEKGCTYTALSLIAGELNASGIETDILNVGTKPVGGCIGCGGCAAGKGCVFGGVVNEAIEKAKTADAFVFGTPVHYASASGNMTSFMDRTPAEIESGLKMVELKPFYEVLVGGRTFTALASQSLTLKELRSYPLISLSDESVTRSLYRQFFLDHGAVLKPDTEAATTDQMLTLVKSELGLAFVPEPMARDSLERGELVQLHLQEIIPTRSICLVYDRHRPLNTAARKFQQMLTKADPPRPAESKQTESISFVSQ